MHAIRHLVLPTILAELVRELLMANTMVRVANDHADPRRVVVIWEQRSTRWARPTKRQDAEAAALQASVGTDGRTLTKTGKDELRIVQVYMLKVIIQLPADSVAAS